MFGGVRFSAALFHDTKPTVVRQCLKAAREIVVFRPELAESIRQELDRMNLSVYKDSMLPLIQSDIAGLIKLIQETALS